jgi:transposase-like protein/IS1 family transposase
MIPDPLFSALLLVGLLWLCLMLHVVWPYNRATSGHKTPRPAQSPRQRSQEPKPFAGLIHKPPCAACAQSTAAPRLPSPMPPAPMPLPNRRPRQVDTSQHFCPHANCAYRGWAGLGNLRANGHPNGGPWRQFHCTSCGGYVSETHGTIFYGKRVSVELIVRVIACLAEGLGIRGTARVFKVDPNTVLGWLVEAAEQLQAFSRHVLHDVQVRQVQLDELFALLSAVKDHEVRAAEAIERLERSPQWVWVAMDPESKLLLTLEVGDRTLAMAQRVVHQVAQVLAPDCAPLFLTDGFREYLTALLTHYGHWVQLPRRQATGPAPKPRWMPLSELLYAQVVKSYRRKRIVRVTHRVVFGTMDRVKQVLAACGWQINTAFVERLNLAIRQRVAAVGRRVNTLCKGEDGLRQQLVLFQSYHNFVLPHASLRQPLSIPEPTNGRGSTKLWRPCTPAMAVGLTDHVWSLTEVLLFRVPPWPQTQAL